MAENPHVIYREGDRPQPVSQEHPLEGLETQVLQVWLENSPVLAKAYQLPPNRRVLENAVREAVEQAFLAEYRYRAQGLTFEQAQDLTRPAMWTPPTWPIRKTDRTPTPAAKPTAGST